MFLLPDLTVKALLAIVNLFLVGGLNLGGRLALTYAGKVLSISSYNLFYFSV